LQEGRQVELDIMARSKSRLDYLNQIADVQTVDAEQYDRWSKTRLNHLLVDYLSRQGHSKTAKKLASDAVIEVCI
jgi:macrophage erythroblast attacher